MLVLFETPAGHALFKLLNESALKNPSSDFESPSAIKQLVELKAFNKFTDTTAALSAVTSLVESKAPKDLRKFLKKQVSSTEEVLVGDSKLGAVIKEKTGLQCIYSNNINNVMRGIRSNLDILLKDSDDTSSEQQRKAMVLGLAHSLSRYKLKFSPDKVDTMIVQAIGLLDELDKEINTYAMRLREWYGWHFPEIGKILVENLSYAKVIDKMGMRTNAAKLDFSDIISDELEEELKIAAEISMGTEISDEDIINIKQLCNQVIDLSDYRSKLSNYLRNRMIAIAPNLTAMVGELVGARLIAHAGSLLALAKYPASTVQILGAEKALFRALKTKHATPKYGLLFHASVVGQAQPKFKGRISRTLASKCSLAIRVDALGDTDQGATVGEEGRLSVEARLRRLEGGPGVEFAISRQNKKQMEKYTPTKNVEKSYNTANDMVMTDVKPEAETNGSKKEDDEAEGMTTPVVEKKKKKKKEGSSKKKEGSEKKKKKKRLRDEEEGDTTTAPVEEEETPKKKSKKKKSRKSTDGVQA